MKTGIVLGTRPEIIKMSPIIREYQRLNLNYLSIHTGQHYSYELDRAFFEDLELPEPDYNLNVGSGTHASQTGKIMVGIEKIIQDESLEMVLVQGDTNTVLGGSLAASKQNVSVGHVEAGLRSFDRTMPEEINRIVSDHVSDLLFAPTHTSKKHLIDEGIPEHKIHITGNTAVDAVYQNKGIAKKKRDPLFKYDLQAGEYFLVTAHRAENTDSFERLGGIIDGLEKVQEKHGLSILYPVHPRTRKMLAHFGIKTDKLELIDPVGYLDFLVLQSNARLILTDSGGIQEEACIIGVPCVTLRDNTERPETIQVGANTLAGTNPQDILDSVEKMLDTSTNWTNPFGDGKAAEKISKITQSYSK
jgi:UDP-N-acetylglucosamine 2-epimerase (non-hydrolysing)